MDRQAYLTLKKELTSEGVFAINNIHGALTILAEVSCFTTILVLLWYTPSFTWIYWILELLAGLSIFRFLTILHECGHSSLFRQKYLNTIVGYCAGVVCLYPYESWCQVHARHHRWVGVVDKDPTQASLLELKNSPTLKALLIWFWRTWLPLGFIKYVIHVFWLRPLQETLHHQSSEYQKLLLSTCLTAFPHLDLILSLGVTQYLTLFGPMLLVFAVWSESVQLTFHVELWPFLSRNHPKPIPYAEQDAVTRNIAMPSILAVLLGYNFYLHLEHHLFPTVPWYGLPTVKQKLRQLSGVNYAEVELVSHTLKIRSQKAAALIIDSLPSIEA